MRRNTIYSEKGFKGLHIYHITSVHTRYDTRIFKKECISLVEAGYDVSLIVCDGLGDEICEGVKIFDAGNYNKASRLKRARIAPKAIFQKLRTLGNIDVVHFHDPELLFLGRKMVKKGIKVIYDSHENVPKQIMSKPYIPVWARKCISSYFNKLEFSAVKKFYAVVTVTDEIQKRFLVVNNNSLLLRNFPVLKSFADPDFSKKKMSFIYAGGVTTIRGAKEMALVSEKTGLPIQVYGPIDLDILEYSKSFQLFELYGPLKQEDLIKKYSTVSVGFCLLHKVPNYMDSYPIKLFEYMASGIAVIASDIPMWKEIIDKYKCGICVDPYNVDAIAGAMIYMKEHPKEVELMGRNGRKAVLENFSWESESSTLISLYRQLE